MEPHNSTSPPMGDGDAGMHTYMPTPAVNELPKPPQQHTPMPFMSEVDSPMSPPEPPMPEPSGPPRPVVPAGIYPEPQAPTPPEESVELSTTPMAPSNDQPMPVVQVLSVRGVEYTMMTLTLWFGAGAIIALLLSLVNGGTSFSVLSFPLALLLVCLPLFSFFFLRLRKGELENPALRFDASKRRLSQFTQVIAFAACLFNVIAFVYLILQKFGGNAGPSLGKTFLNLLIVLAVAGGILAYYWFDEHRLTK